MSEVGRDSMGGMSRAAKRRRKGSLRKQMSASSSPAVAVDSKQRLEKPKKSSFKLNDSPETSAEDIDLTFALNCEEYELSIMKRKDYLLSLLLGETSSISDFYEDIFEKRPLEIRLKDASPLSKLFSFASFQHILRHHLLTNQRDIFLSKVSSNHMEQSPSHATSEYVYNYASIMESYKRSFGICLLQPHTLDDSLWKFLSVLEIEFNSRVFSKVYYLPNRNGDVSSKLTNPQFLPSNVFYLLLQGNCSFRLYNPDKIDAQHDLYLDEIGVIKPKDLLASEADAKATLALEASQVLYVPKGWIVDFESTPSTSSSSSVEGTLMLAICFNESGSVADLVDTIIPQALAAQIASNAMLKKSLPSSFISLFGVSKTSEDDEEEGDEMNTEEVNDEEENAMMFRKEEKEQSLANKAGRKLFSRRIKSVFESLVAESMGLLDAAADQMAKSFLIDRLPVPMTALEERLTSVGSPDSKINILTRLRMLRPGLARAMVEDGMVVVYHCMDNSRALHGNALSPLEFELDDGPAIEKLLDSYPRGVLISQLPHPSEEDEDKVAVAATLYKEGFLVRMDDEMEEMKDSLSRAGGEEGHTNYDANESDDSSPF